MTDQVTLTIDGVKVTAPKGMLIVDAAKLVHNDIPVFCYHPKLKPVGMCRMCLVEVGRMQKDRATGQPVLDEQGRPKIAVGPKLETACTTPVEEGMMVTGASAKVKDARDDVIELLLTSHPLDCPVCDKGGECPLQDLTMRHGPGTSRFLYDEKQHLAKHVPLGDLIYLDTRALHPVRALHAFPGRSGRRSRDRVLPARAQARNRHRLRARLRLEVVGQHHP